MNSTRQALLCITLLVLARSNVSGIAGSVPVANSSFENIGPQSFYAPVGGDMDGWHFDLSTSAGTASASVTAKTNSGVAGSQALTLQVDCPSSAGFSQATATSASSLLSIAPATTYTVTVAASAYNLGAGATISLLAGGTAAASADLTNTPGTALVDFSASFTTSPTGDARVGQPLTVQLDLHCNAMFHGSDIFDNIRLTAEPGPKLTLTPLGGSQMQISWPTAFPGFTLVSTTDIQSGSWTPVANPVDTRGNQFVVAVTPGTQPLYFRLQ